MSKIASPKKCNRFYYVRVYQARGFLATQNKVPQNFFKMGTTQIDSTQLLQAKPEPMVIEEITGGVYMKFFHDFRVGL